MLRGFGAIKGNFRDFQRGSEGILGISRGFREVSGIFRRVLREFWGIQGNFKNFWKGSEGILGGFREISGIFGRVLRDFIAIHAQPSFIFLLFFGAPGGL